MAQNVEKKNNNDPIDKVEKFARIGNLVLGAAFTVIQIVLMTRSPEKANV